MFYFLVTESVIFDRDDAKNSENDALSILGNYCVSLKI